MFLTIALYTDLYKGKFISFLNFYNQKNVCQFQNFDELLLFKFIFKGCNFLTINKQIKIVEKTQKVRLFFNFLISAIFLEVICYQ